MSTSLKEFENCVFESFKRQGLTDVQAKIFAYLHTVSEPVTFATIAKQTKYSLPSVSLAIKFLHLQQMITLEREPGSKKFLVSLEQNMQDVFISKFRSFLDHDIALFEKHYPVWLEKNTLSKDEEVILKRHAKQTKQLKSLFKKMLRVLEE